MMRDTDELLNATVDECERLREELAQVKQDAERYRWLRDVRDYAVICERPGDLYLKLPRELDAAIDGAREGEKL